MISLEGENWICPRCSHRNKLELGCPSIACEQCRLVFSIHDIDTNNIRGDEKKHDDGKPMWDLLPFKQVAKIVDVLTFGCRKYGARSWQDIPDGKNRYFAALMRHLTAWKEGERVDPDSGIHHLAHAGCNILFLLFLDDNEK